MIYLVDLDGTIADCSHRLHFIKDGKHDWNRFFSMCAYDEPIRDVIDTVNLLGGYAKILITSGRSDEVRLKSIEWLDKHNVRYDRLYMRQAGDHRPDNIVKREMLDKIRLDYGNERIVGVFDDRKQVVDMWRAEGLKVFHVAEGDF